jgi:hypothetical protein
MCPILDTSLRRLLFYVLRKIILTDYNSLYVLFDVVHSELPDVHHPSLKTFTYTVRQYTNRIYSE